MNFENQKENSRLADRQKVIEAAKKMGQDRMRYTRKKDGIPISSRFW